MGTRLANANVLKSKGIVRKRKPNQGNAKLHLREKYDAKMNKRKNYVKDFVGKPDYYGGEETGIRRDIIKGTKLS